MDRELYCVLDEYGNVLAYHMEKDHALLFIKALLIEYYADRGIEYRIKRENLDTEEVAE